MTTGIRAWSALCAAMVVLLASSVSAQVPAGLAGTVKDSSGGVMPGVTVEATSPALIEKVRAVVTDSQGQYRIIELPPGVYAVTFTLGGFSPVTVEGIALTSGLTGTVHADLKVGSLAEAITVVGQSPLVDVQSTATQRVITRDILEALPTNKGIASFAALTPGITVGATSQDVGGNKGELATMSIHGSAAGDQRLLQDGMRFNSMEGSGRGFYVNPAAVQEVNLGLGGNSGDSSLGGVQVNVVPKEGGNQFTGYYFNTYTKEGLQGSNLGNVALLSGEADARGLKQITKVKRIWDVNAAAGGPVKQDKLWFFTAHRHFGFANYIAAGQSNAGGALGYYNSTQGTLPSSRLMPNGRPAPPGMTLYTPDLTRRSVIDEVNRTHTLRATWQASQRDKFVFSVDVENNCDCHVGLMNTSSPEAVIHWSFANPNYLTQAIWTRPISSRMLVTAGVTTLIFNFPTLRQPGVGLHDISIQDQSYGVTYNSLGVNSYSYGYHISSQSNQKVDLSYVTGSHHFKIGVFTQQGIRDQANTNNTVTLNGQDFPVTYRVSTPTSGLFANVPSTPNQITQIIPYRSIERMKMDLGIYASDQWTMDRLTMNMALRYDNLDNFVPALTQEANVWVGERALPKVECLPCWTDWSPRFGAAYDLTGDGKTSLKGSVGRYVAAQSPNALARANAPVITSGITATRTWNDAFYGAADPRTGNFIPDCDLRNVVSNAECGVLSNSTFGQGVTTTATSDPDILTSHRISSVQASMVLQRELRQGLSTSFGYYRTWYSPGAVTLANNTRVTPADYDEYCVTAPIDSRLPNSGQQVCGLYDLFADKAGQVQSNTTFLDKLVDGSIVAPYGAQASVPERSNVYDGFDVTMQARFSNGAFVGGGTNTGRTNINSCQVVDSPGVLRNCAFENPFQTQLKLAGAYPLPWDLQFSATFQNLPGIAVSANYVFQNSEIIGLVDRTGAPRGLTGATNVTVNVLNPNTVFEPRLNQLDLRFSKTFRVGTRRFEAIVDSYNVTNSGAVLSQNGTYSGAPLLNGGNWRLPTEILAARFVKFGFQANF